jgi:hypothetical protein
MIAAIFSHGAPVWSITDTSISAARHSANAQVRGKTRLRLLQKASQDFIIAIGGSFS